MSTLLGYRGPPPPDWAERDDSEPASERADVGCMTHSVYMNFERKNMSLSQIPRNELGTDDVQILRDDWATSHLPTIYQSGATLCAIYSAAYDSLRGNWMCFLKGCHATGTVATDEHHYCPEHMLSIITPPTTTHRANFVTDAIKMASDLPTDGISYMRDNVLLGAIERLRGRGILAPADIPESLTATNGGRLLGNAFRLYNLAKEGDGLSASMAERLGTSGIQGDRHRNAPPLHPARVPTSTAPPSPLGETVPPVTGIPHGHKTIPPAQGRFSAPSCDRPIVLFDTPPPPSSSAPTSRPPNLGVSPPAPCRPIVVPWLINTPAPLVSGPRGRSLPSPQLRLRYIPFLGSRGTTHLEL